MSIVTKSLDFHQTFKPERSCLASLLSELPECNGKSLQEISSLTGIPMGTSSGKVLPTICYLEYMGMIECNASSKKYFLTFTPLGKVIASEDPGIMEKLTLLLFHCMLTRPIKGADLWNYVVCDILPKYHGFISKANFETELQYHYKKDVNASPFNGTYTGILEPLNLLEVAPDGYQIHSHPFNPEFVFLYALILYEYWDEWVNRYNDSEKSELNISDLEITSTQLDETRFRLPFGWNEQDEYRSLEAMHDKCIISLNRQMVPFSIRKIMSRADIENLLFSELC